MNETNKKVTTNLLWRFMERCGAQGVSLIVSIILARLLDPAAYGTIAMVTVFTNILNVFINCGLGGALIQKKDADNIDFSTVFFFNIMMCTILYIGMFFAAPLIASFYERPELTSIVRVLSLTLVISGVKNIQHSYVSKYLLFKRFFFATLGGTIGAAFLGIFLAYKGYGVWALIIQGLFNNIVDTIILWITVKWRPQLTFSFERLKGLFSYGWKLLASALLETVYNNLRQLIIGKKYSSSDLAFYNKGKTYPDLITTNINNSIDSVLLPIMSAEQDSKERVCDMTRRAIKTSSYLMMPLMVGLAVCAEPVIRLILTEKWLPCVPYLRVFCFTYAFYPIHTANLNAIKAMGRSDIFLKLEIIKKVVGLTAVLISMWFGVIWMAYSLIITSVLSQIINSYPNKKLLGYSYINQVKDMLPQILLSAFMGVIVYFLSYLPLNDILIIIIQVITGGAIYIGGSALLHFEPFEYVWNLAMGLLKKKKA